jgi:hypothetical protein
VGLDLSPPASTNSNVSGRSRLAQLHRLNLKEAMERIYISRAFTANQITALIMEKLKENIEKYAAKVAIISNIAGFFQTRAFQTRKHSDIKKYLLLLYAVTVVF